MSKQGVMADFDDLHLVLTGWNRYFRSIEQNLLTRCLSAELHFVWAEINVYVSVSSKEKSLSYSLLLFIRWSIMFRICFENLKSMVCGGKGIQTGLIFVKLKKSYSIVWTWVVKSILYIILFLGALPMTRSGLGTTMVIDHVHMEGIAGAVFS